MVNKSLIGFVLSVATVSSVALTLGPLDGNAVIGQPLRLRIQLSGQNQELLDPLCPVVKVRYGEEYVSTAHTVATVRTDSTRTDKATLQIEIRQPLTEPYVGIDAVLGCENQVSRTYTLLSDLPSLDAEKPDALVTSAVKSISQPTETDARYSVPASVRLPAIEHSKEPLPRRKANSLGGERTAKKPPQNEKIESQNSGQSTFRVANQIGARLQLDPMELVSAVEVATPKLRMSLDSESAFQQTETLDDASRKRREVARTLWSVLNGTPEEAIAEQAKARIQSQHNTDLQARLTAAQQEQQAAQQRVLDAENAIYTHPITLALLLVILIFVFTFLYQKNRPRSSKTNDEFEPAWWKPAKKKTNSINIDTDSSQNANFKKIISSFFNRITARAKKNSPEYVDSYLSTYGEFGNQKPKSINPKGNGKNQASKSDAKNSAFESIQSSLIPVSDFTSSSLLDGGRSVATEELLDLQQQVEFFISLGQADQAVEVLLAHLVDSNDPSPLAYLDLLKLYHELGRRSEYDSLRIEFNRIFTGLAPAFDAYAHSKKGLEFYENTIIKIQNIWGTSDVIDLIERLFFHENQGESKETFELEAYRDLLLLYSIARELAFENHASLDHSNKSLKSNDSNPSHTHSPSVKDQEAHSTEFQKTEITPMTLAPSLDKELDLDLSKLGFDDKIEQPARSSTILDFELPDDTLSSEFTSIYNNLKTKNKSSQRESNSFPDTELSPHSMLELNLDEAGVSKFSIRKSGIENWQ